MPSARGARIFELTAAKKITFGRKAAEIRTAEASIRADRVVIATGVPTALFASLARHFWFRSAFLALTERVPAKIRQRLGKRRDPRIDLALPVHLTGTDISGRPLDQRVMTVNISRRGALLDGIHGMLRLGDKISLARLHKKEEFRVAWVGGENTPAAGQIGVAAVDPNTSFWDEVLEATAQSGLEAASLHGTDRGNGGGTGQ